MAHIDKIDYQLIQSIIQISRAKGDRVIAEEEETVAKNSVRIN